MQTSKGDAPVVYDQGVVTLTVEFSTLSTLVAEARFIRHGVSQIMAGREKFLWSGLARVGVRLLRDVLSWYK